MIKPYSDKTLRQPLDKLLYRVVPYIPKSVVPNQVTYISFILGIVGSCAIIYESYYIALLFLALNRIGDALDGVLAHARQLQSDAGGFLDILLDFTIYSLFPLAFAIQNPDKYSLISAILIFSFMICGSSFLSFAIFAQKYSLRSKEYKEKSIYYMQGIVEGAETCVFMLLSLLFPQYFVFIGSLFASLCLLTGIGRIYYGYKILIEPPAEDI